MDYVKLLTKMRDDPKVIGLSDKAFRAYIVALCWCGEHETDGKLPRSLIEPKAWNELRAADLIDAVSDGTDAEFNIHNWGKHQRTKEQLEALRAERRASGKQGGLAKARAVATPPDVPELEVEVRGREVKATTAPDGALSNGDLLAEALLSGDSTAQYLLGRMSEEWQDALTPGALLKLGKIYGAEIVTDALRNMREEGAGPFDPYPYLESVCVRLQSGSPKVNAQ